MIFASTTGRDLSHDSHPYRQMMGYARERDLESAPDTHAYVFDPRPEFDHVQHNEPNRILVEFREDVRLNPTIPAAHLALIWVERDLFAFEVDGATLAHADHARRVLNRLAALDHVSR